MIFAQIAQSEWMIYSKENHIISVQAYYFLFGYEKSRKTGAELCQAQAS